MLAAIADRCGSFRVIEPKGGEALRRQAELENEELAERLSETASSAAYDVKMIREIFDRL